jgi:hypothetical protein
VRHARAGNPRRNLRHRQPRRCRHP